VQVTGTPHQEDLGSLSSSLFQRDQSGSNLNSLNFLKVSIMQNQLTLQQMAHTSNNFSGSQKNGLVAGRFKTTSIRNNDPSSYQSNGANITSGNQ
jgi:hypothetical protein